jgi:type II secretory pathway predicted ATPase ExeA
MYETFFGLQHLPFSSVPAPEQYLPFDAIKTARETIERAIDRGEGPALLVAPTGIGKTLLCQLIARRFEGEFSVAMLAHSKLCTRRALLQNILFALNLPFRKMDEGELRLSLMDFVDPGPECDRGLLLIVDEAHTFSTRLLEELRLITNLVRNGQPRVRLLLSGTGRLEEIMSEPQMESFQQRVAARCYLHALTRDEVREYVQGQLIRAGAAESVFSDDAYQAVHDASDGIPRLINQICDHALLLASVGRVATIQAAGVVEAWTDLQQLPTPWTSDETQPTAEHFIEFGTLDDEQFGELLESDANSLDADLVEPALEPIANIDDQQPSQSMEFAESTDLDGAEVEWPTVQTFPEPAENGQEETCWIESVTMKDNGSDEDIAFESFSSLVSGPLTSLDEVEALLHEALQQESANVAEIERAEEEDAGEELDEPSMSDSQIRDIIPLAGDPFGGDFAEEIVIYDPPETNELPWRTLTVERQEGESMSDSEATEVNTSACEHGDWRPLADSSDDEELPPIAGTTQDPVLHVVGHSSADVLLPFVPSFTEYGKPKTISLVEEESDQETPNVADLSQSDDRDILIIEDSSTDVELSTLPTYEPMAERREYTELLSQLRQEQ